MREVKEVKKWLKETNCIRKVKNRKRRECKERRRYRDVDKLN